MRQLPKISILVPVYNREDMILSTLQSAVNQTYPNVEIIVFDNNSTDKTFQIISTFATLYGDVKVYKNKQNIGPVRNWQSCLAEAKGEYIKFLFSDDLLRPDCLARMVRFLENPEVGFVFSEVETGLLPGQGKFIYSWPCEAAFVSGATFIRYHLFEKHLTPVSPTAALFRTKDVCLNLVLDIPSNKPLKYSEHGAGPDELLFLLTAMQYPKVAYVGVPLVFFRGHQGSITRSTSHLVLNEARAVARMWFLKQYGDDALLNYFFWFSWINMCINNRKYIAPQAYAHRFSNKYHPYMSFIGFRAVLSALAHKIFTPSLLSKKRSKAKVL